AGSDANMRFSLIAEPVPPDGGCPHVFATCQASLAGVSKVPTPARGPIDHVPDIASDPDRPGDPGSGFTRHPHPVSLAADRGARWYLDALRMSGQQLVELPGIEQLARQAAGPGTVSDAAMAPGQRERGLMQAFIQQRGHAWRGGGVVCHLREGDQGSIGDTPG